MSPRRGERQLAELRSQLTGIDLAVLQVVYDFRLATGSQLHALFYPAGDSGARGCRRALERLTRLDLLRRLDRRIGGVRAGSASFLYAIGPIGERILRVDAPRRRLREPSWSFVDHTLSVLDSYLRVVRHARDRADVAIGDVENEPACWRSAAGVGAPVVLRPDLFMTIDVGELELRWFIEIDRGTEHVPAVLRKCAVYDRYYRTGIEQEQHGVFPRVMWITTSDERADRIARELAASTLTTALFQIDTIDRAIPRLLGDTA